MRFTCVPSSFDVSQVEILSDSAFELITPFQLRQFAAMVRGESIKTGTLRTWRNRIGIHPDDSGCYSLEDLRLLGRYLEALAVGRTTTQFLNQEYGHAQ
jgi:hypothetical protein